MASHRVFGDFHIHIGQTPKGQPVKISAARNLTFSNIMVEASERKGMDLVGIIDAHAPGVQDEIATLLDQGTVRELEGGGLRYQQTTVLLGCELEIKPDGFGPAHLLCYFPFFTQMKAFTTFLSHHMKNVHLSTQRYRGSITALLDCVENLGGVMIPAHVFTPFRSLYGSCTDQLSEVLPPERLVAIELGLSADTLMADGLSELHTYPFLSNSDAHSLPKIGREYNALRVNDVSFHGWVQALKRESGARIMANYGLDPRLGKYHRTLCRRCEQRLEKGDAICPNCGSTVIIKGVRDRIEEIKDNDVRGLDDRPPYIYQIPLEFIPKIGPKTLNKLLNDFGTEMNIIHQATQKELNQAVGERLARQIVQARYSQLDIQDGGGGLYGKIKP